MIYEVYESMGASSWHVIYECETFDELNQRIMAETDWDDIEIVSFDDEDSQVAYGWTREESFGFANNRRER